MADNDGRQQKKRDKGVGRREEAAFLK